MKKLIVTAVLALSSVSTFAFEITGNDYLKYDQHVKSDLVVGMVIMLDYHADKIVGTNICIPEGVSAHQTRLVFDNTLAKAPQLLHLRLPMLFSVAMEAAFPCKK